MAKKIIIDAGHYNKYNRSPVVSEYYEGNQVWILAGYLKTALQKYGFTVGMTKNSINGYPKNAAGGDDVYARGKKAKGYDLMLSLHSNACGTESVDRAVIIPPVSGKEKSLAEKLGKKIKSVMGVSSYQIYQRANGSGGDYYGVIRGATAVGVPCIIIEHGFHTNKKTANWLLNSANLKKLADAEAEVIAKHYGMVKTTQNTTQNAANSADEIYRVRKSWDDEKSQKGAYKSLNGAKATADKFASEGYKVYNSKGEVVYTPTVKKSVEELAREVIAGKWGMGTDRKKKLTEAGYDYAAIQAKVNELLK